MQTPQAAAVPEPTPMRSLWEFRWGGGTWVQHAILIQSAWLCLWDLDTRMPHWGWWTLGCSRSILAHWDRASRVSSRSFGFSRLGFCQLSMCPWKSSLPPRRAHFIPRAVFYPAHLLFSIIVNIPELAPLDLHSSGLALKELQPICSPLPALELSK